MKETMNEEKEKCAEKKHGNKNREKLEMNIKETNSVKEKNIKRKK